MSNLPMTSSTAELVLNPQSMQSMVAFAEFMCQSVITVPKHLQGNSGDCLAVTMQAMQWGMNPYAVAQKTHIVSGNLGYEAQLVNAVIISKAPIIGRPEYEWYGDWSRVDGKSCKDSTIGVRISIQIKGHEKKTVHDVSFAQVGTTRNSPNWVNDPKQQIAYLAMKKMSRLYFPDVILGVYTTDELMDARVGEVDVTPEYEQDIVVSNKNTDTRPVLNEKQIEKAIVKINEGASFEALVQNYNLTEEQYEYVKHKTQVIEHADEAAIQG